MSIWLVVLVFAMFAAAIYIAAGSRRETLRSIRWAFVLVGLLVLVVRRVTGNYAINTLAAPAYREPARHAWLIASSILGEVGWAVVFYGLVGALGAVLAGPTRAATAVRRRLAVLNGRPGIAWGIAAFAYLLLVLWGGTHALRTWLGILLLGGLFAIGVAALRRQLQAEFPEGSLEPAAAGAGSMVRHLGAKAASLRPEREAAPASPAATDDSPAGELTRLAALHDRGALSDAEFVRAKAIALS